MADLRSSIFNFFYRIQNEGAANSSQPFNKPEAVIVYGAFLMNALQKTNKSISKISNKITDAKKKCDKSEKKLVSVKASIEEAKARKEQVLGKLNNLKTEVAISKRAIAALNGSIKKAKKDHILTLANIEETKKRIKQKKDQIEILKKELAKKQSISQDFMAEYRSILEKISKVLEENDLLEKTLGTQNAIAQDALHEMKEEANNLRAEVNAIEALNSEARTVESNIAELIRKVNKQAEEKALREQKIISLDRSTPQFWRYLVDFLIRSKDHFATAVLRPIQEYMRQSKKKKMIKSRSA